MTRILLIRHAMTAWNHDIPTEGRYQGNTDVPLSSRGKEQAAKLAAKLQDEKIDAIYASDLSRAAETAAIVAAPHKLIVHQMPKLREIHYGIFEGLTLQECIAQHKDIYEQRSKNKAAFKNPGGESPQEMQKRVVGCVEFIIAKHKNETIVLVVHSNVLKALISHFLKKDLKQMLEEDQFHFTSITELDINGKDVEVVRYNSAPHLHGDH